MDKSEIDNLREEARKELSGKELDDAIKAGPIPMVTSYPCSSKCRDMGPEVVNLGKLSFMSFSTSNLTVTFMGLSIAVPQTSPSPWAAWASPMENNAPGTSTGR